MTVWSLFGACDWNSLLTRTERIYEPGAFDIRGPEPRPTALAEAARSLATTGRFDHPVLAVPGWWRRPERLYAPEVASPSIAVRRVPALALFSEPGPLANECLRIARQRGLRVEAVSPGSGGSPAGVHGATIWGILDATGAAAGAPAHNATMAPWLRLAARDGLPYVFLSRSDVFAGLSVRGFVESDAPSPRSAAGRRRAEQEDLVLATHPGALVIRTGTLFGPGHEPLGRPPLPKAAARPRTAPDQGGAFSYVPDLVHVMFDLLLDGETGTRHLVNGGAVPMQPLLGPGAAARLATERGVLMPPLDTALAREAERQGRLLDAEVARGGLVAAE